MNTNEYFQDLSQQLSKATLDENAIYQRVLYREYVKTAEEKGRLNEIDRLNKLIGFNRNYFKNILGIPEGLIKEALSQPKETLETKNTSLLEIDKKDLQRVVNKIHSKN